MRARIQNWDEKILFKLLDNRTPTANKMMIILTILGNGGLVWFASSIPFFLSNRWRLTGYTMLFAMIMVWFSGEVTIKHIVRRKRPCHVKFKDYLLIKNPPHYSFPSSHSSTSFAVSTVVMIMCPWWGVPFMIMAGLIAFSRMYMLVHYPSDVLAGVLLGIIGGIVVIPLSPYIPFFYL